jgi:hypothetical protein
MATFLSLQAAFSIGLLSLYVSLSPSAWQMSRVAWTISVMLAAIFLNCKFQHDRVGEAIHAGVENLRNRGPNILPAIVSTLDHLIRDYKLDLNIDELKKKLLITSFGQRRILLRYLDPQIKATKEELKGLTGIDRISAAAMYCDVHGLPAYFWLSLRSMADSGGYALTHATIALMMVRSKNCVSDDRAFEVELAAHTRKLLHLLSQVQAESDLGIEAIVMLYLTNNFPYRTAGDDFTKPGALPAGAQRPPVRLEWIGNIIEAQKEDGSWNENDHTTVLALWALLEFKRLAALTQ